MVHESEVMMSTQIKLDPRLQLKYLAETWDDFPALIARSQAPKITGGAVSVRTLELDDQYGRGPIVRHYINNKVVYPKAAFLDYLESKITSTIRGREA